MCARDDARITGLILAGGRGTRMGGVDKGLVDYRGRPLVEWVLHTLAPQVDTLLLSANRNLAHYARYGHPVVPDTLPDYPGPLAGVLAGMLQARSAWLLVVPCDTPQLPPDLAARLLAAACEQGHALAVAADDERIHHTCFIARTELASDLAVHLESGSRAVRAWHAGLPHTVVRFDATHFVNLNSPDDTGA